MRTGYQSRRGNCWRQVFAVVMLACVLGASTAESSFADMSNPIVLRATKQTIVEGTSQLSPPAIQFDEAGALHLAWFEKSGDVPTLKTVRISDGGRVAGETVQVNPVGAEPDALHGLTIDWSCRWTGSAACKASSQCHDPTLHESLQYGFIGRQSAAGIRFPIRLLSYLRRLPW